MDCKQYFKKKYPYMQDYDLDFLIGRSKEILIHLLFPSEKKVSEENKAYAYSEYEYWLISCVQEMVERMGCTSAIAYSENGISLRFSEAQLSKELKSEIIPFAGIK